MRGILAWGAYLPYRRLDRADIRAVAGGGGGTGTRSVAAYDEDTTTMAVEAARVTATGAAWAAPATVWFATTAPAYLDKTNAAAIHAALRLDRAAAAYDAVGSVRSAAGALRAALSSTERTMVVAADIRVGLPGGPDEVTGGDGAAAVLVGGGGDGDGPLAAELLGQASVTEEFLDRWRAPGDAASKQWEERFGETRYVALGEEVWRAALKDAGVEPRDVGRVAVVGPHPRANAAVVRKVNVDPAAVADDLAATIGNTGAAHPSLVLASVLDTTGPETVVVLVVLADGADAFVFRTTPAVTSAGPAHTVADQVARAGAVSYGRYLAWRGLLRVEPPRRPEPPRTSAAAASRAGAWKFGLVGSEDEDGNVQLPPSPDDSAGRPMADASGTVVTYTVDRLAYSPSPPVVFAVVDFDGGGRLPIELTDVDAGDVAIGDRVEMTFRRLHTADGVHNYFWKARPRRHPERSR